MSDSTMPVRAWAEYDEWSVFLCGDTGPFWLTATPKGATGNVVSTGWHSSWRCVVDALTDWSHPGPLRSLRILLSTGHTVRLELGYSTHGPRPAHWMTLGRFPVIELETSFTEESDIQAVTRALAEAVAWIEEQAEQEVAR